MQLLFGKPQTSAKIKLEKHFSLNVTHCADREKKEQLLFYTRALQYHNCFVILLQNQICFVVNEIWISCSIKFRIHTENMKKVVLAVVVVEEALQAVEWNWVTFEKKLRKSPDDFEEKRTWLDRNIKGKLFFGSSSSFSRTESIEGWAVAVVAHPQEDFTQHFAPPNKTWGPGKPIEVEAYMFDEPQAARYRLFPPAPWGIDEYVGCGSYSRNGDCFGWERVGGGGRREGGYIHVYCILKAPRRSKLSSFDRYKEKRTLLLLF